MKASHVLVVAPGRRVKGGITSVVRAHSALPSWDTWQCRWIETAEGDGAMTKLVSSLRAFVRFLWHMPTARIVHIHVAWKNSAVRKLPFFVVAKLRRARTIVHLHAPDMGEAASGLRGTILGIMLRQADRVAVLSDYWRSAVVSSFGVDPARIVVVPNPVAIRVGRRHPAPATVLFVGKLEERKGVAALIRSFQRVRSVRSDAELRLAGNNTQFLQAFSAQDLTGVRALGWLSARELAAELDGATCLCLPSRGEGVPMAVLEAMAARCPVVTTLAGGLVDVVEHGVNGFVVPIDDVGALADELLRVIADQNGRERVADAAAARVADTHGVQRVNRCLHALYSGAIGCADRPEPTRERTNSGIGTSI